MAKASTPRNVTLDFAVVVSLKEQDLAKLESLLGPDETHEYAVRRLASQSVKDLIEGGMMIPAAYAQRIRSAVPEITPEGIAERVERSAGRDGESTIIELRADPAWLPHIRECAERAGLSLSQHLKAIVDWALAQGWLGMVAQEPHKILLTKEQRDAIAEVLGKDDFTGEDIYEALSKISRGAGEHPGVDIVEAIFSRR